MRTIRYRRRVMLALAAILAATATSCSNLNEDNRPPLDCATAPDVSVCVDDIVGYCTAEGERYVDCREAGWVCLQNTNVTPPQFQCCPEGTLDAAGCNPNL